MILLSRTVTREMDRVLDRMIGAHPTIEFYDGEVPASLEDHPVGAKLDLHELKDEEIKRLNRCPPGPEPPQPSGATFWRLYDAGGRIVMQGDWQ